jgi:hypothetical protein
VDWLAVLADELVVFLGAHGALYGVSFMVAYVVCGLRGLTYGVSDGIVRYKGWEVVEM